MEKGLFSKESRVDLCLQSDNHVNQHVLFHAAWVSLWIQKVHGTTLTGRH